MRTGSTWMQIRASTIRRLCSATYERQSRRWPSTTSGSSGPLSGPGSSRRRPADNVPALIFDCDGVLADTERDGHRPAFNETFAEVGVPVRWSEEEYGEKLKIGGGKERMGSLLTDEFVRQNGLPIDAEGQKEMLADWHRRKTGRHKAIVRAGRLPARSGIARIVTEAMDAGWALAGASPSAEGA